MTAQESKKPDRKKLTQAIKAQALKVGGDVVGGAPLLSAGSQPRPRNMSSAERSS